jgi:hypothetical protein
LLALLFFALVEMAFTRLCGCPSEAEREQRRRARRLDEPIRFAPARLCAVCC